MSSNQSFRYEKRGNHEYNTSESTTRGGVVGDRPSIVHVERDSIGLSDPRLSLSDENFSAINEFKRLDQSKVNLINLFGCSSAEQLPIQVNVLDGARYRRL